MWSLLLLPVLIYVVICVALFFAQRSLIFPVAQVATAGPPPPGAEALELTGSEGRLRGIHIPPARQGAERLLLLGFAGNGTNAQRAAVFTAGLAPEADVVFFHYRGYPPSEGVASAEALLDDAPRILDLARARIHPDRTVAVGFSVGSGVAGTLAARRPLDGLILVTPFDSLERVSADHYPWLPVRLLFRHPMEPATALAGRSLAVAIIAAGNDQLVFPRRTEALRSRLSNIVFDRVIPDTGHNDIYDHPAFAPAFREALDRVVARR
ncbi:MAG TPA: alpha/beta fold hydrolase [Allosphingosinicella sp.]|nr:alpha/beta fold hydrolase [Allosphingosinicella sp.]